MIAPSRSKGVTVNAIQHNNLKEQIVESLRTAILGGQMIPGHVYKAADLAQQYGASRTPVREAILELASRGLVEVTRGVGFRVTTPSPEDALNVMEIRQVLESWTMRKISGQLPESALRAARAMVKDIDRAARRNDLVAYWIKDRAFHAYLVSHAANPRLDRLLSELRDCQRIGVLAKLAATGSLRERNQDHVRLIDAVAVGDGELAAALIHQHIELNKDDLVALDSGSGG